MSPMFPVNFVTHDPGCTGGDRVSLPEHDWLLLRSSHDAALGRYCARVLEECAAVIQDADSSAP